MVTDTTDPETSPEQQERSLALPIRQENHTSSSQTAGTQLSGVDFFPLGDEEEEEEASSSDSRASSPAPPPGFSRVIEVEEPIRTPYPEEEPEEQVRNTTNLTPIVL